jgi:hypothetical protein
MSTVWSHIERAYTELGTVNRLSILKATMFLRQGDFPKLKGKAANVRAFGAALLQVWEHFMNVQDPQHRRVRLGLKLSVRMEQLLDVRGHVFSPAEHDEFARTSQNLLLILNALANDFHSQGRKLFHFTIKSHYVAHIAMMSKMLHPRAAWCYSGEGFMQTCKKICISCAHGSPQHLVSQKAAKKFLNGMAIHVFGAPWR